MEWVVLGLKTKPQPTKPNTSTDPTLDLSDQLRTPAATAAEQPTLVDLFTQPARSIRQLRHEPIGPAKGIQQWQQ